MKEVTDPGLIAQLEGSNLKEVTDPAILAQLEPSTMDKITQFGKNTAAGIIAVPTDLALGGMQRLAENGMASGPAQSILSAIHPELAQDFKGLTNQDVSNAIQRQAAGISAAADNPGGVIGKILSGGVIGSAVPGGVIAGSALAGGGDAYLNPETGTLDQTSNKAISNTEQAGAIGAAGGVVLKGLGAGIRALTPVASDALKPLGELAQQYNIPFKVSDVSESKPLKYLTSMAEKAPLSGATAFDALQQERFNNELGKTIGVPDATKLTPEVLRTAFKNTGALFDRALAGRQVPITDQHVKQLIDLAKDADSQITGEAQDLLTKNIRRVLDSADENGTISGEKLGALRSSIAKVSRNTGLNDAKPFLGQLTNLVADISTEGNPAAKATLDQARSQWKNLITVEPLAAKNPTGNIPPSQLHTLVQRNFKDYSTGGGGDLGNLARIGKGLLANVIPDSGTATREGYGKAITGATGAITGAAGSGNILPLIGAAGALGAARGISSANRGLASGALGRTAKQGSPLLTTNPLLSSIINEFVH